ncbi:MAG TPA: hypothetical protein VIY48_09965 [Candidatus Paceibacterota bacterium]
MTEDELKAIEARAEHWLSEGITSVWYPKDELRLVPAVILTEDIPALCAALREAWVEMDFLRKECDRLYEHVYGVPPDQLGAQPQEGQHGRKDAE